MAGSDPDWATRVCTRLNTRALNILMVVARCGSMAKAARELGMSQPSISEALANLEAVLRVRLLDRSPRGVEPTIYAQALINRGAVIFDELKQGIREIEFLANPAVGEVRVGCPESLAAGFLPAVIETFSRENPGVAVDVIPAEPAAMQFRELHARTVDLMIGRVLKEFPRKELNAEILFEDSYVVIAGTRHPLANRRRLELKDLVGEAWISLPPDNAIGSLLVRAFKAEGLSPPQPAITSFSLHVRTHLLATGRFVTANWASMLKFNARWSLKRLPVELGIAPVPVAAITLRNRTSSPAVERFIEHARAVAKEL